jgi:hypothetical protein
MGFEILVRPFERPQSIQRKRLVASNTKIDVSPARITFGQAGQIASPTQIEDAGSTFSVLTCDDKYIESSRQTTQMRIVQKLPDGTQNPDNFVDLDRPYEVKFEKIELASQKRGETQVWSNTFETAQFETTNPNTQNKCQSTFELNRALP